MMAALFNPAKKSCGNRGVTSVAESLPIDFRTGRAWLDLGISRSTLAEGQALPSQAATPSEDPRP